MTAAKHCDRDPGKTCSGSEVRRQAVLRAEQLVDCDQARKGAAAAHRQQDYPRHPYAGGLRRERIDAGGADLVAERGPAQQDQVDCRRKQRQECDRVEWCLAGLKAGPGGDVCQGRQPQRRWKGPGLQRAPAGGNQYLDKWPGQQRGGDEVEHDRSDDEMAAAPRLQH